MNVSGLLFGTAGVPLRCKERSVISGIPEVRHLGLDVMELEFVRQITVAKEKAAIVREASQKNDVLLTCHAPYYINLNSFDNAKLEASKKRILDSARIASLCGAWSVCFHPGFYQGGDKKKVYEKIVCSVKEIVKTLKNENISIWLRPETTGKASAFGDIYELIQLSSEVHGVLPCVDFAHLHARSNGLFNSANEVHEVLSLVEKKLGREALNNMHIHYNGIKYSEKGELHHLIFEESDADWHAVIDGWKDFKIKGAVISESPNIEEDALLMQRYWKTL
ncbi:TIM barrel protein [Candidatus Woesearchaeota archaeon]|nr:TIM barrel protein [Candidatus Woesearchaeota archaeon]